VFSLAHTLSFILPTTRSVGTHAAFIARGGKMGANKIVCELRTLALAVVASLLGIAGAGDGKAQTKVENLVIESQTPLGPLTITRQIKGGMKAATITAELHLPDEHQTKPIPAMLIMHGSGGLTVSGPQAKAWTALLNSWGVATLIIDSFGPRGLKETSTNQRALPEWAHVADAFAGFRTLAANPRIDATRIGIMGFSRGANASLYTAFESFRRVSISNTQRFAVHIPFYASCAVQYRDEGTDKSPILYFHGEADNMTLIEPCREYLGWFESVGSPVTFVSYKGAYHGFDRPSGNVSFDSKVSSYIKCDSIYDIPSGEFTRVAGVVNPPLTKAQIDEYWSNCFIHGANVGRNAAARADAIEQVHRFLTRLFRLKH
jgi:dienelactone hydrolase